MKGSPRDPKKMTQKELVTRLKAQTRYYRGVWKMKNKELHFLNKQIKENESHFVREMRRKCGEVNKLNRDFLTLNSKYLKSNLALMVSLMALIVFIFLV